MRLPHLLCLLGCLTLRGLAGDPPPVSPRDLPRFPAVEPARAAATFQVRPGFHVELAAAEPLVASSIAVCFDENGRMFVLEMRDYPEARDAQPHLGRVRMLEDTDGDGIYDKATVFADDLPWPTGLLWANGGLFVMATPDLLRFTEKPGEGRAGKGEVIFTGFQSEAARMNVQALPNSLQWGPDNRIHLQVSLGGAGRIRRPSAGDAPVVHGDFYFDPRTYAWGTEAGGGQYGMSYDNAGRRYTCNNSDHLRAFIYDSRLAAHATGLPPPLASIAADGPAAEVFRISPDEPWRVMRTRWRVSGRVPGLVEGGGRVSGYFTGATGTTVYRGDAYPPEYVGDTFTGDAGGNLVHHKRLRTAGASLLGERPADEAKIEFAASRDTWFRPVSFANAPDGTLYIVDMYREVIEHPWSIPAEIKRLLDLTSGRERGRIWRLAPDGFQPKPPPQLGRAAPPNLVSALGHPNGWHRDTATRLLLERQEAETAPRVQAFFADAATPPLGRLHALRVLIGLGPVPEEIVLKALRDPDAAVRELGVQYAVPLVAGDTTLGTLERRVIDLAADPEPRVRLQVALALGALRHPADLPGFATLARRDAQDPWISAAVAGAPAVKLAGRFMLSALGAEEAFLDSPAGTDLLSRLAAAAAAEPGASDSQSAYLAYAAAEPLHLPLLVTLAEGLGARHQQLAAQLSPEVLARVYGHARSVVADQAAPLPERIAAARLLGLGGAPADSELLWGLIAQDGPVELQRAALEKLAPQPPGDALPLAQRLLAGWKDYAPAFRAEALHFLMERPARAEELLRAVKEGRLPAAEIPTAEARQLQSSRSASVSALAQELLPKPSPATRDAVIQQYAPALSAPGEKRRGHEIYTKRCSACHRLRGEGHAFGPDLESVLAGGKEQILTNILDPNREVAPQYAAYTVELRDGTALAGIVAGETATHLTLREPLGKETILPREQVARLETTGRSPMPEGLEAGLTIADLASLLEFLTAP